MGATPELILKAKPGPSLDLSKRKYTSFDIAVLGCCASALHAVRNIDPQGRFVPRHPRFGIRVFGQFGGHRDGAIESGKSMGAYSCGAIDGRCHGTDATLV